ncbi:MAG: YitT family protein [Spirochaetaceae bacterium]|jgi:uncharacterized membrane-anchored protein YitT (DUF2179 family)|nr:YitT family protein [Spirochaetaceae bacterium]
MQRQARCYTVKRLALILTGSAIFAFNLNTFVHAGSLIPGGFTGLALLVKDCFLRFTGLSIPFSIINYSFNAVPAIISFKFIGKKFTLYSCLMIVVSSLLTDFMPSMFIEFIQLHDTLLAAVFGGILNAFAISLCLFADATSGGTDFIAVFFAEKYRKDTWNYIFAGNCVILAAAGFLFTLDKALYSIIFQFTTTLSLNSFYRGYQQKTLFIITNKPNEICALIYKESGHGVTAFDGTGLYTKAERKMLYSVVSAGEAGRLVAGIKKIDPESFINVLKTESITGNFYIKPRD